MWLRQRRFTVLLLALVLLLVLYPPLSHLPIAHPLFAALRALFFMAAFLVVFEQKQLRLAALLLGGFVVVSSWFVHLLPSAPDSLVVGHHVVAILFLSLTVVVTLRVIYRAESVSADAVYGAFCGYLVVGLAFGHLYCLMALLRPGAFRGNVEFAIELEEVNDQLFRLTYFSLATLTTLGYGDIIPATDEARGLAVVEAILGQFYIAVLVADLIGRRVSQMLSGPPAGPQPPFAPPP